MMNLSSFTSRVVGLFDNTSERRQYVLIGVWILVMIALPILKWTLGAAVIPDAVTFALIVQFSAVLFIMLMHWGNQRTFITLGIVAVSTWSIEFLGSSTGFPFGNYDYTDALQPQLGHVPLLIPLAWFMMLPPSWAIAEAIVGRHRLAAYVITGAIAITAWDLFLDPQMAAWGFWVWETPQGYFGIPWSNYAGWLLTGIVVTLLVRPYRFKLPLAPLLTVYGVVWWLQSIGLAVFWGQPGPALIGSVAMGLLLILAVQRVRKTTL